MVFVTNTKWLDEIKQNMLGVKTNAVLEKLHLFEM